MHARGCGWGKTQNKRRRARHQEKARSNNSAPTCSYTWNNIITEMFDVFFLFYFRSAIRPPLASTTNECSWRAKRHSTFIYVAMRRCRWQCRICCFAMWCTHTILLPFWFGCCVLCRLCRHLCILCLLRVRRIRRVARTYMPLPKIKH